MEKYCPEQFRIVGCGRHDDMGMDGGYWTGGGCDASVGGKDMYRRLIILPRKGAF